ncbi:MAG: TldD/PmbA family protein [Thermoprotei archaeon]
MGFGLSERFDEDICLEALSQASKLGCDYAEVRLHTNTYTGYSLRSGVAEPAVLVDSRGVGVRVIYDGCLGFGATNVLTREAVAEAVEAAVKMAKNSGYMGEKYDLSEEETVNADWTVSEVKPLSDLSAEVVVSLLRDVDSAANHEVKGISFPVRLLRIDLSTERKLYMNSEGSKVSSVVPRVSFHSVFVGLKDGERITVSVPPGYSGLGGSGGFELVENLKLVEYVSTRLAEIANTLSSTTTPPRGEKVDVILGPNVASLTSHESVGHPFEMDRILGREAAQAGESYLNPQQPNIKLGGAEAYVSDDPTIPNSMGFYLYDDEGVKARRRRLLQAGQVSELLLNRATAKRFGVKSNASARAVRYNVEPLIRMANTYIEPGDWEPSELLKDTNRGVYIKSFMEWNIDDKRLNQRYVGLEAFLIEGGEIKGALNKPILEISTPTYWSSIDARAKDLEFYAGMCGKGDPMQGAPVYFGAPHIRLRSVVLG